MQCFILLYRMYSYEELMIRKCKMEVEQFHFNKSISKVANLLNTFELNFTLSNNAVVWKRFFQLVLPLVMDKVLAKE